MRGLGISSVPHLTITSPLVNRLCSSRWNYRRCQSPHKGCRLASSEASSENLGSHPSKADHRACNKQHPHSDALCIPRSYLHDNRAERPITSWLASNLTWPTVGKYHSKPFFPTKPLSVSLPVGACELQALTIFDQLFNQSPHLYQWRPENTGDMVGPRIQTQDLSDEN